MPRPKSTLIVQAATLAVAVILGLALNVFLGGPRPKLLDLSWPAAIHSLVQPSPVPGLEAPQAQPAESPEEAPQDQPQVQAQASPEPESQPEQAMSEPAKSETSLEPEPAETPAAKPEAAAQPQTEQAPDSVPGPEPRAAAGEQAPAPPAEAKEPQLPSEALAATGADLGQPSEAAGPRQTGNTLTQIDITNDPRELQVLLKAESEIKADKVVYFALKDWGRLVVDFYGDWQIKAETPAFPAGGLAKRVRLSLEPGKLRLVIDLWEKDPAKIPLPSVRRQPQGFLVRVAKAG
jgi:cytoskeletal protein RodZ